MDEHIISDFYFNRYNLENIIFEYNPKFGSNEVDIDIKTEIESACKRDVNEGYTKIKMSLWDESDGDNYPFKLEITIIGFFSGDDSMERNKFEKMCQYNGAAILFPFLRSAITDITKASNVSPLVLPLINIKKFIDEERNKLNQD
ncbi:MAG: hypothetical protein FH762_20040 [Firmicutes bacterium]|nr:hypothetical protein [Bacillota bacterium]